jgi:putative ABC transport system permease protein
LSGILATVPFAVDSEGGRAGTNLPNVNLRVITPGYLDAAGTRLLSGRAFSQTDRADSTPVALVSAALADRYLAAGGPERRRILIDDNSHGLRGLEVVGVVENVSQTGLDGAPSLDVYIPLRQMHPDGVVFLRNNQFWAVRTGTDPRGFQATFREALASVDRDAAISSPGAMRQFLDVWLAPRRFTVRLFVAFSLTAVLVCLGGVYGLMSHAVNQRRREIAVLLAIGASSGQVRRMFLRQAVTLTIAGTAAGGVLAWAMRPVLAQFGASATISLPLFGMVAAFLVVVAILAGWLPARRAARVDAMVLLRAD